MTILQLGGAISLILLAFGMFAAIYRIVRGPATLDRAIATDVLVICISSGTVVIMALTGLTDYIMFVVVASVIGFVGSVTLSRFTVDGASATNPGGEEAQAAKDTKDAYVGYTQGPGRDSHQIRQAGEVAQGHRTSRASRQEPGSRKGGTSR